jgi:FkbM family methyltransferase
MRIEIGTSDFRTLAGIEQGLYIEPIKYYFDRLPDCNKLNIAISNYEGEATFYYLTDREIIQHSLPKWIRGCNSIHQPHPTTVKLLQELNIPTSIIHSCTVKVKRLHNLLQEADITQIDYLKIDTEGHDTVILKDFLINTSIRPQTIQFENNSLSDSSAVKQIVKLLEPEYQISNIKYDIICQKK